MTTSVQNIFDRATALSVANQGLASVTSSVDVANILYRVSVAQAKAFTRFNDQNRTANLVASNQLSNAANGGRVIDLSGLPIKVERIVIVKIASTGVEVAFVDIQVPDAELAPRYTTQGEQLVEISNDWDPTTGNAVSLSISYLSRPADLNTAASDLSQLVSIPDRFTDYLVYDLGAYFALQDVGREDAEVEKWESKRDEVLLDWLTYASHFGGVSSYRFAIPKPDPASKA